MNIVLNMKNEINDCNANDMRYWDNSFADLIIDTNNNGIWDDGIYEDVSEWYIRMVDTVHMIVNLMIVIVKANLMDSDCMLDCDGVDQQDPSQDFDSFCNWLFNLYL